MNALAPANLRKRLPTHLVWRSGCEWINGCVLRVAFILQMSFFQGKSRNPFLDSSRKRSFFFESVALSPRQDSIDIFDFRR